MVKAVAASNIPVLFLTELSKRFELSLMPSDPALPRETGFHPDMNMTVIGKDVIIPASFRRIYPGFVKYLEGSFSTVHYTSSPRSSVYPHDATLNCLVAGKYIVCRADAADATLASVASSNGYEIINVKQGYSACSSIVCGNSVITCDRGINSVLESLGIDSLLVSYEGIRLDGYNTGFIGGAGGFCDGTLYFYGNIDRIASGAAIRSFAEEHGYEICSLSDGYVYDYGGIKFF